eukprot:scaffold1790_cov257-Pinguiococcus_pyrenoidosus.AAC.18
MVAVRVLAQLSTFAPSLRRSHTISRTWDDSWLAGLAGRLLLSCLVLRGVIATAEAGASDAPRPGWPVGTMRPPSSRAVGAKRRHGGMVREDSVAPVEPIIVGIRHLLHRHTRAEEMQHIPRNHTLNLTSDVPVDTKHKTSWYASTNERHPTAKSPTGFRTYNSAQKLSGVGDVCFAVQTLTFAPWNSSAALRILEPFDARQSRARHTANVLILSTCRNRSPVRPSAANHGTHSVVVALFEQKRKTQKNKKKKKRRRKAEEQERKSGSRANASSCMVSSSRRIKERAVRTAEGEWRRCLGDPRKSMDFKLTASLVPHALRGKNDNEESKRELLFKEDGQVRVKHRLSCVMVE